MRIESPRGDGNAVFPPNEIEKSVMRIESPRGDGNFLTGSVTSTVVIVMRIDSPRGDGNQGNLLM